MNSKNMSEDKKVKLPSLKIVFDFLLALFIPLFVLGFVLVIFLGSRASMDKNVIEFIGALLFLYVVSVYFLSRYKQIIYNSTWLVLMGRSGASKTLESSDIVSVDYFSWLKVYIKNIDAEIEMEVEEEMSSNDFPDSVEDAKKNFKKMMTLVSYYVYPVCIRTKNEKHIFLIDEKTLKELTIFFSSAHVKGVKTFKYNEKWNWLVFAFAIFAICFTFVYVLAHPK